METEDRTKPTHHLWWRVVGPNKEILSDWCGQPRSYSSEIRAKKASEKFKEQWADSSIVFTVLPIGELPWPMSGVGDKVPYLKNGKVEIHYQRRRDAKTGRWLNPGELKEGVVILGSKKSRKKNNGVETYSGFRESLKGLDLLRDC